MSTDYYKNSLNSLKGSLTKIKNRLKERKDICSVSELEVLLKRLCGLTDKFDKSLSELKVLDSNEANEYSLESFDDGIFEVEVELQELIKAKLTNVIELRSGNVNAIENKNFDVSVPLPLPTIVIPEFDGKFSSWCNFKQTFTDLIHNNAKIAPTFKFHYLKSCLEHGSAFSFINGVPATADNYKIVWDSLFNHYENESRVKLIHMGEIHNLKPVKDDQNPRSIRMFVDSFWKPYNYLKNLKVPIEHWDLYLVYHICQLVPSSIRKEIEMKRPKDRLYSIKEVMDIIEERARISEAICSYSESKSGTSKRPLQSSQNFVATDNSNTILVCFYCKQEHSIYKCSKFEMLSWQQRYDWVKENKLCVNCFRDHHITKCRSKGCRKCHKNHNTLLHINSEKKSNYVGKLTTQNLSEDSKNNSQTSKSMQSKVLTEPQLNAISVVTLNERCDAINGTVSPSVNLVTSYSQILLSTAVILVEGINSVLVPCRVLLDQGAQSNFVTEELCQKLRVPKLKVLVPIVGINDKESIVRHQVNLRIKSRVSNFQAKLDFLVIPKISSNIPLHPVNFNSCLPKSIKLADPTFYIPQALDMIIGAELFSDIFCLGESIVFNDELPPFQNTKFGYVVCGKVKTANKLKSVQSSFLAFNSEDLHKQIQKFFQIEEIGSPNNFSLEEKACEEHYINNVKRDTLGRYSVALPTKSNLHNLGESLTSAIKQYLYVERKLKNNSELKEQYNAFMEEYISLNHMTCIGCVESSISSKSVAPSVSVEMSNQVSPREIVSYYLPHHAVFKENSTTTKLRVVFNASSKCTSGLSLNDVLMTGPTIQGDIFSILVRFRKFPVALVADITKMYRQVLIHKKDRNLQRIIWRTSTNQPLSVYQLNTVTYGTTSAPFAAIRTLRQLALDEFNNLPRASEILNNDFYVDDLVSGTNDLIDAKLLKEELTQLLAKGGFELRKWVSNEKQVLEENELPTNNVTVLGIPWDFNTDHFVIRIGQFKVECTITKRIVLSQLTQLFDPMGLCAPIVFTGKLIMRDLWSEADVTWDDNIPDPLYSQWRQYIEQLNELKFIKIPRCILPKSPVSLELHGFGDASEKGFGCCIYIRYSDKFENYYCNLLCAKSRVSPSKKHTIPRLELCSALLLAQLYEKVQKSIKLNFTRICLWSDSTITLYRIISNPSKYSVFVANRISKIQDICSPNVWFHIPTNQNPADIVSRGVMPSELEGSKLWWNGPSFLVNNNEMWPTQIINQAENNFEDPEISKYQNVVNVKPDLRNCFIEKYSSFQKLLRISALCLRFINNTKKLKDNRELGNVTPQEIHNAKSALSKFVQQHVYGTEIKQLQITGIVNKTSSIRKLSPFLDDSGVLRVGGRLENSSLNYNQIHPILLPSNHEFSKLIVQYEHHRNLHAGPQALLSHVRQKFWIVNGRSLCKKVVYECIRCFRTKPVSVDQFMGQLPGDRVRPSRTFSIVGIDFCGPFNVHYKIRSNVVTKVYICLFICFATKATHLEVVTDLTTNGFLAALRRFISRRGRCSHIFTDNATNFVGCQNELIELQRLINSELHNQYVTRFCSEEGIVWHTIPPRSPHFGGLWESAIKSAKYHLKRSLGNYICTIEELNTLVAQIEACLNSRPLSAMSEDPSDYSPLTPGHFIIGEPLNLLPEPTLAHLDFNRLNRFQRIQFCFQEFWRRWSLEYLTELQIRQKWFNKVNSVKIGTLVILKEDNLPPIKWTMGRISEVHPGKDGLVRVVSVKTSTGLFKRALSRVCMLPVLDESDNVKSTLNL